nr:unnamed protein product [Rangifer tarandus platyrhynchus]
MRFFPLDLEGAVTGLAATQSEQLGLAHRGDGHASLTAPSGPGGVSARFLAPRFWAVILLLGLAMMSKGMSYHGRLRCRWTDPAAQAEWPGPRQRSPLAGPEGQLLPVPPKLPASQHFDWEVAERSRKPAPLQRCPVASARHPARDQRSERGLVQAPEKGAISSSLGAEEGGPYTKWGKTMYAAVLIRENKNQSQDFQAVVVEVVRGEYGCGRQKQRMAYAAKLSKGFNDGMSASLHRADNAHGEQLVVISYDTCVCTGADGRATAAAWLVAPVTCRRGCGWVSRPDTRSGVRLLTRGCYCSGAGGSAPQLLKQKLRVGFAQALLPVRARPAPQEVTTEACEAPEVSEYLCRPCGCPRSHQTARGCIFSSVFVPDLALSRGHRHCRGCAAVGEPDCAGADLPQHLSLPISAQRAELQGSHRE